jgi:hypothetical protein
MLQTSLGTANPSSERIDTMSIQDIRGPYMEGRVLAARFWKYVDKTTHPSGCWLWTGALTSTGYGQIGMGSKTDGTRRPHKAHRVAWELSRGKIPQGMSVLHHCDNPPCVNPDHLFIGTQKDNAQDMGRKGRAAVQRHPEIIRGERNANAVLTTADVLEIRRLKAEGMGPTAIARQLGTSYSAVQGVFYGYTWKHLEAS